MEFYNGKFYIDEKIPVHKDNNTLFLVFTFL